MGTILPEVDEINMSDLSDDGEYDQQKELGPFPVSFQ